MKNIAIIGTGISGLTSAYLLSQKHKVRVFEANDYIGGHTATVDIEIDDEKHVIDTGFIVFNNKTYPKFLALMEQIGIGKQDSEMSFSVHNCQTGLEYNGHNLNTLFAQRRNIFNPTFWRLIREILRFNKACKNRLQQGDMSPDLTLKDFLREHKFSQFFSEHYILPMGAAIWSSSLQQMEKFQLKFFLQFFNNHGLLNISDRPQWYVVPGGSREYIKPLIKNFSEQITLNSQINAIRREQGKVFLDFADDHSEAFDEVVIACHSDQALALLKDASKQEQQVLGAIKYSPNNVILHTDTSLLPKRQKAWASWNYQLSNDRTKPASVTYNMNILQGLNSKHTFCVTLNQKNCIDKSKILREFTYHHPVFNNESMQAQANRNKICGQQNTHFAGAYWYNGFHEDGVRSAVDVAARFDCHL
ncbi:NAD(P)/FAD-dependent oxidoreductase [Thalassotalea aquiviva]|uniref:NAD(P)/FAD-dependent oxidoreductase n=1 Tax=Thalassotalea aquiviva TaxID=3242415 RepID=UPI00352A8041